MIDERILPRTGQMPIVPFSRRNFHFSTMLRRKYDFIIDGSHAFIAATRNILTWGQLRLYSRVSKRFCTAIDKNTDADYFDKKRHY